MTTPAGSALWRNRAKHLNMRARMYQADGHLYPYDLREIVRRDGSRCVYCQQPLDFDVRGDNTANAASFDHIVRLCDGGSNTYANVACACRGCNQRNAARSIDDPTGEALKRLRLYLARKQQTVRAHA